MARARPPAGLQLHEDPALMREALEYTANSTEFDARLIEKDYYCTVALAHFAVATAQQCVFKGGTCLAKVHVGFYRLSEDLDFTIPMPVDAKRTHRRKMTDELKAAFNAVPNALGGIRIAEPLRGFNDSTQYAGTLAYKSVLTGKEETITIEAALREPLIMKPAVIEARTMLLDPLTGEALVGNVLVACIVKEEAFAEKFRAAATRREVAIRDFYDLDHASRNGIIDLMDAQVVTLIRKKLAVPGNDPLNLSADRLVELRAQLEPRLRPVLRQKDYDAFDLDRAFALVLQVAEQVR